MISKKPKELNLGKINAKTHCERALNELVSMQGKFPKNSTESTGLESDINALKEICEKELYQMNNSNTRKYQDIKAKHFPRTLFFGGKRKTRARTKRHHRRTTRKH